LSALFAGAASLSLRGNEPRGVIAEVRLPYLAKALATAAVATAGEATAVAGATSR